jgi:hypothetical protein
MYNGTSSKIFYSCTSIKCSIPKEVLCYSSLVTISDELSQLLGGKRTEVLLMYILIGHIRVYVMINRKLLLRVSFCYHNKYIR